jgi:hypothetical protein
MSERSALTPVKAWVDDNAPALLHTARRLVWLLDARGRRSRRRLRDLKDRYRGQRCFILGNGPSLKGMDLSPLGSEITFTLNRGYLLFERMGKPATYHVVVNPLVAEQWGEEMKFLACTKFTTWGRRRDFHASADVIYIGGPDRDGPPRFSIDPTKDLWVGATVTYVAMQLAYYFGFSQVILIGVDHRFSTPGEPHTEVVTQGEDRDHFDPQYFGGGARWNLPDLETSELAYALARHRFHKDGREILDATVGGALRVFPRIEYSRLFPDRS